MTARPMIRLYLALALLGAIATQLEALPPNGGIKVPPGTTIVIKNAKGAVIHLKPAEQVAFLFASEIGDLEDTCSDPFWGGPARLCTLAELVRGVPKHGGVIGLTQNPARDPNYTYKVTISTDGDRYEVDAIPRVSGLAGFMVEGKKNSIMNDTYYEPHGQASELSQQLNDMSIGGNGFKRR